MGKVVPYEKAWKSETKLFHTLSTIIGVHAVTGGTHFLGWLFGEAC